MNNNSGEWEEGIQAFWFGANDCEWIAWKGSHQIFVYPCGNYPNPPSQVIQFDKRIETIEDFTQAMETGVLYDAFYKVGKAYWQNREVSNT